MDLNFLLIFLFNQSRFAFDATRVRETVYLPELTLLEETPPYVVGIFSLRGQIVPVIDLNLRFGHSAQPYQIDNQVIVLEWEKTLIGVIVSEVCEVIELTPNTIQPFPQFDNQRHLVTGDVRVGDSLVTLLDINQLIQHLPNVVKTSTTSHPFYQQVSTEHYEIYRSRAKTLMEVFVEEDVTQLSLAVFELSGEYFAIELHTVQEFCDLSYPPRMIPCCPTHVLGVINLRGNLIVLLDIRSALNLPNVLPADKKIIITCLHEQLVSVVVDQLCDVLYLQEGTLQIPPEILPKQHQTEIKGTIPYADKMIAVLDLSALLARDEWIVNENV